MKTKTKELLQKIVWMLCGGALSVEIILFIIEKEVYMQDGIFSN